MKKYIVYKISGGLCHMLNQINQAIHFSILSDRKLIIDCQAGAFKNDFNKYFNIPNLDYSTDYSAIPDSPYINEGAKNVPMGDRWTYTIGDKIIQINLKNYINSEEEVIYFTYMHGFMFDCGNYIAVNKDIFDKIKGREITDEYIGVHFRNTDWKHDIQNIFAQVKKINCKTIYLATDDFTAYDKFVTEFPERNVIRYTIPKDCGGGNIHYGDSDKDKVIMDALTDLYYLMKSNYFIQSSLSSYSKFVLNLKTKNNFFV